MGLKTRVDPPYPHARRKRRLKCMECRFNIHMYSIIGRYLQYLKITSNELKKSSNHAS